MGQKDLYQSDFYEDKSRFADVFNGVLFEGREVMKPYVNDFKLNLFDYHEWKEFGRFKTANRLLFEALSCGSNAKKMKETLQKNPDFARLDLESAKAISGILGVKMNLDSIKEEDNEGREMYNMCKAFDDYKEEGRREGRRAGLAEGRVIAAREFVQGIDSIIRNLEISLEEACTVTGSSVQKYEEAKKMLNM